MSEAEARMNRNRVEIPTDAALLKQIRERRGKWVDASVGMKDISALSGVFQFGPVEWPEEQQLTEAREFNESIIGSCVRCGSPVHEPERLEEPSCGHLFCQLHIGRGHADPCSECEEEPRP